MASVRELESYLFERLPASDAESWDNPGLSVGFADDEVTGIAIALDPSVDAIDMAVEAGCNVLLTHHPVFISAPESIVWDENAKCASACIVAAISKEVSLISMHTNLDRNLDARRDFVERLGLDYECALTNEADDAHAFGCKASFADGSSVPLAEMAIKCEEVFGAVSKVYGNPNDGISRVAVLGGSASDMLSDFLESGCDLAIVGEMSYHRALELVNRGIALIELGHDVSEFPILSNLRDILAADSRFDRMIHMIDQQPNWWLPRMVK